MNECMHAYVNMRPFSIECACICVCVRVRACAAERGKKNMKPNRNQITYHSWAFT